jgi:catechol 2,3-dioxygenase-like lactoylglutathione lyase family enzyme
MNSTPLARIDNIGLAVRDVAAEAAFFGEKLGLPVDLALDGEPPSATVAVGDQYLYVFQTTSSDAASVRSPALVENPPGVDHISFTVDDVDSVFTELKARGVEFEGEPASVEAWGIRLVAFRDPEANSFFLVQKL